MQNFDVLIVDDEDLARKRLRKMLTDLRPNWNLRFAENGSSAVEQVQIQKPDLILLDIQMPEMSGFDVVKNIENQNIAIIFQTAHDEFALKAFEVAACDYLLKPFSYERLEQALKKFASSNTTHSPATELPSSLGGWMQKIRLKSHRETLILDIDRIECFTSQNHCTCVLIDGHEFTTELSLDRLEKTLNPETFFRAHRSHMVNLSLVQGWTNDSPVKLKLRSGQNVPVARRQIADLKSRLSSPTQL